MNHEVLKSVIFDQREIIQNARIVPRRYTFDSQANYVVTGLRRAGKSTLLYKIVRDLVESGVDWNRIIYINFEDERLAEFSIGDFNDILSVHSELSTQLGYYFFDEIQNVNGWEKFARRLADAGERVWITGSNAKMLSSQIATTLGGRYLVKHVTPYRFDEYLDASGIAHDSNALYSTKAKGSIAGAFDAFYQHGGFPESLRYDSPREYVESVYQKVLLGDIAARNNVRNPDALRVLMKKVAETVCNETSATALHGMLNALGYKISKATLLDYLAMARESYLLFEVTNVVAKFVEREGNPKRYFSDNGLLNLFLIGKEPALLENEVAVAMLDAFGEGLHYLKSPKNGIDVDFYVPEQGLAVQVAYSLSDSAKPREVGNLVKLANISDSALRLLIVTKEEERVIEEDGKRIEIKPAWKFLLQDLG
ncbi:MULTISPECIES: ATP-binding protein [Coriobacteriia]|uniref:ATP-binding protein n=1 Tax=Coriobacteriia TaxID=84998 RepID=UPI000E518F7E|nr:MULTISPECIES: ATP-binding protein [Coriobacteriia]MBN2923764.1 ATP-binding protein [Bifidobacterium sp.]RHO37314.1 ATP-binding protein [Eggerthella sp. AM16-19]